MSTDLSRFIKAQENNYLIALQEIQSGRKQSHWMWYIFPQIQGLGHSPTAQRYAINALEEAIDYLNHPVLGARLIEICHELLKLDSNDAHAIFGSPDHLKLHSSVTLFSQVNNANPVFLAVLEKFFDGKPDHKTLDILNEQKCFDSHVMVRSAADVGREYSRKSIAYSESVNTAAFSFLDMLSKIRIIEMDVNEVIKEIHKRIPLIILVLPIIIAASIGSFIDPLSASLLDMCLFFNIVFTVIILFTMSFDKCPMNYTYFPAILLTITMFRLILNIASTWLILSLARSNGEFAAGHLIQSYADFIAGNIIVGFVIFVIFVFIQFQTIMNSVDRIREKVFRFTNDTVSGRQFMIDADLHAGVIDKRIAEYRHKKTIQEANWFRAMDAASSFVRGDAIAGIFIMFVNIFAGLFIGIVVYEMPLVEAGIIFTKLTIGAGFVSQVPALFIAFASGWLLFKPFWVCSAFGYRYGPI